MDLTSKFAVLYILFFLGFPRDTMGCNTKHGLTSLLLKLYKRTTMFISACAYAIDMVSFFKVRASKSAHNLIVHFRSYLASSLFLADSLKKVPNIQQRVHYTTPSSAMSMCLAGPDHVAKQCLVAILTRPVIVSALRKKKHLILRCLTGRKVAASTKNNIWT